MKRTPIVVLSIAAVLCLGFVAGRFTGRRSADSQTSGRRILYWVDPMHPAYRSQKPGIAPDCGMALEPVYEGDVTAVSAPLQPGAVALSAERQQLIGIRVAPASKSTGARMVRTTGRVVADENHLYKVTAGFDGWVQTLNDNPAGTLVKKNQVLASLYGPDIRTAEVNYIGFLGSVERLMVSMAPGDQNQKSIEESGRVNTEQLRLLGMGEDQIKDIGKTHRVTSSLELVAPGDGLVLFRGISSRQQFQKGTELYRIADLSKVWIVADIHGEEGALRPGTHVKVHVPEVGKTIQATVSTATPLFDDASRTLKLRLEADNPGLLLRPDMFVDVEFEASVPAGLSVPADAVLDSGLHKIVYVESADGVFEPRPIQIAAAYGDRVTIASGITEGDRIVVAGNFLLDSESRMRAAPQSAAAAPAAAPPMPPMAHANMHPAPTMDAMPAKSMKSKAMPTEPQAAAMEADVVDPVCGMSLKPSEVKYTETYQGKAIHLCSDSCRTKFLADPARFAGEKAASTAMTPDQAAPHHD